MVEFAAKKVRKLCRPDSSEVDLDQSEACLVHLSSLEVDSDQSEACLDDLRGFVDGMDGWDWDGFYRS